MGRKKAVPKKKIYSSNEGYSNCDGIQSNNNTTILGRIGLEHVLENNYHDSTIIESTATSVSSTANNLVRRKEQRNIEGEEGEEGKEGKEGREGKADEGVIELEEGHKMAVRSSRDQQTTVKETDTTQQSAKSQSKLMLSPPPPLEVQLLPTAITSSHASASTVVTPGSIVKPNLSSTSRNYTTILVRTRNIFSEYDRYMHDSNDESNSKNNTLSRAKMLLVQSWRLPFHHLLVQQQQQQQPVDQQDQKHKYQTQIKNNYFIYHNYNENGRLMDDISSSQLSSPRRRQRIFSTQGATTILQECCCHKHVDNIVKAIEEGFFQLHIEEQYQPPLIVDNFSGGKKEGIQGEPIRELIPIATTKKDDHPSNNTIAISADIGNNYTNTNSNAYTDAKLDFSSSIVQVRIYLAKEKCNQSHNKSKAVLLQKAMADLFPGCLLLRDITPFESDTSKRQQQPIKAKVVYSVVDNIQYKRILHCQKQQRHHQQRRHPTIISHLSLLSSSLLSNIPGLRPQLRPYQQAAVDWMIQRETRPSNQDEWELAWIVLFYDRKNKNTSLLSLSSSGSVSSPGGNSSFLFKSRSMKTNIEPTTSAFSPVLEEKQYTSSQDLVHSTTTENFAPSTACNTSTAAAPTANGVTLDFGFNASSTVTATGPSATGTTAADAPSIFAVPLPEWKGQRQEEERHTEKHQQQQQQEKPKNTNYGNWNNTYNIPREGQHIPKENNFEIMCYYCPFMGWFANSMKEARSMTISTEKNGSETCTIASLSSLSPQSQMSMLSSPLSLKTTGGGGILAESMGLGKTIEVLACILANPCPPSLLLENDEKSTKATMARRAISMTANTRNSTCQSHCFDDHNKQQQKQQQLQNELREQHTQKHNWKKKQQQQKIPQQRPQQQQQQLPFLINTSNHKQSPSSTPEKKGVATSPFSVSQNNKKVDSCLNSGTVNDKSFCIPTEVTPDKKGEEEDLFNGRKDDEQQNTVIEERWLHNDDDDLNDILGSCICGSAITVNKQKQQQQQELLFYKDSNTYNNYYDSSITAVICTTCQEPLHVECACFNQQEWKDIISQPKSKLIIYRHMFTNKFLFSCREFPERFCPCCIAAGGTTTARKNGRNGLFLVPSRATLIVTPSSILNQWEREISKHTTTRCCNNDGMKALKVVVYPGIRELNKEIKRMRNRSIQLKTKRKKVNKGKNEDCNLAGQNNFIHDSNAQKSQIKNYELMHPRRLADADIVLMTFDSLMNDLCHSGKYNPYVSSTSVTSGRSMSLRKRKRYRIIPSPLCSIRWWRVCLDEAQRVETPTSGSAQMALQLETHHRWCVSGTPVGRGNLDDLYGLLLFLRVQPFSDKTWFRKCFSGGSCTALIAGKAVPQRSSIEERIYQLLKNIFWRSTKAFDVVREQMGVPEQIEKKTVLKFSSIEKHFYNRQLEKTLLVAGDISTDNDTSSTTLENTCDSTMNRKRKNRKSTRKQLDVLARQLHVLRAACCHPQVGSSGITRRSNKKLKKTKASANASANANSNSTISGIDSSSSVVGRSSGILSMEQILDRLIDDAKMKCEEAQRLCILHMNAMAAVTRLKAEVKQRDLTSVIINDSNESLLAQSCKLYLESLDLAEENAKASAVVGESILSGNTGFRSSNKIVRQGKAILDWQLTDIGISDAGACGRLGDGSSDIAVCSKNFSTMVWCRFDYEGPSKKIRQIRVRALEQLPGELAEEHSESFSWNLLCPKDCVFQVSSAAVGDEFVDVASFSLPPKLLTKSNQNGEITSLNDLKTSHNDDWVVRDKLCADKSKSWRILVKSYYQEMVFSESPSKFQQAFQNNYYLGLEVELYEPGIANDSLQRLHCLHNAAISFTSLLQLQNENKRDNSCKDRSGKSSISNSTSIKISVNSSDRPYWNGDTGNQEENNGDKSKKNHTNEQKSINKKHKNKQENKSETELNNKFLSLSSVQMESKIHLMQEECREIESRYMETGRVIHMECHRRLREICSVRERYENELLSLTKSQNKKAGDISINKKKDSWDDGWWEDALVLFRLSGTVNENNALCDKVYHDLDNLLNGTFEGAAFESLSGGSLSMPFPHFNDITGLLVALKFRIEEVRSIVGNGAHRSRIQLILDLSPNPSDDEVFENSHCSKCKADWNQTGPKCRHCKLEDQLDLLLPDRISTTVLDSIYRWMRGIKSSFRASTGGITATETISGIESRAKKFFEILQAQKKEKDAARRLWRVHLDLLNNVDELNQCKSSMRLAVEGEDLSEYTEDQLNAIVVPFDICARFHDHSAKQAMALANLRRYKHTLQFLKNQSAAEHIAEQNNNKPCINGTSELGGAQRAGRENQNGSGGNNESKQICLVCLSEFTGGERAVLSCGHSFHYSPCLEKLMARSGNHRTISCPLRCTIRTKREDILIASDMRQDDGSKSKRNIKGSWGTKVTALIADVLDLSDLGEKGVVFSMWEDMLDVIEEALKMNGIKFVRVTSLSRIGHAIKCFRSNDCFVLLMNVKNGAEGLTILEATHIFMVEPLLNCGLDIQAINRIHRIGQTRKTYVHRYLIQDTIETNIDKVRMEHQEDQLEDSIHNARKHSINAGGIDGGFSSQEELMGLLQM